VHSHTARCDATRTKSFNGAYESEQIDELSLRSLYGFTLFDEQHYLLRDSPSIVRFIASKAGRNLRSDRANRTRTQNLGPSGSLVGIALVEAPISKYRHVKFSGRRKGIVSTNLF
jgi:hypothetical protein